MHLVGLLALASATLSVPQNPLQPDLLNPGLDGGTQHAFAIGEFTPDGRLLIGFRRLHHPTYPTNFNWALSASLTQHENLEVGTQGELTGFFEPLSGTPYGQDFTFGEYGAGNPDWALIHWGYELLPCTGTGCILPCGSLMEPVMLNPDFPIPNEFGSSQMTLAMRPLETANPYPSDALGDPDPIGGYLTYKLWIVRLHYAGYTQHVCQSGTTGSLVKPVGSSPAAVLACQDVTVVVDASYQSIVHTDVEPYELITTSIGGVPTTIRALEPSITADGRLILFHGKGDDLDFFPGDAVVTYIYNPNGCEGSGWSHPRSITELPQGSELGGLTAAQFKQRYRLFAEPIRMPRSNLSGAGVIGDPFLPGENVTGTYPWVSKDGSFYNAYSVRSSDALGDAIAPQRTKSCAYACGDVTGWSIKHVDDVGLNPTRLGGPWAWPRYNPFGAGYPNSWGAMTMSTGVKPGLWEPLLGLDVPLPSMEASYRIPVLPLFLPIQDTYGEVRFEESDGNYLLYMACKESLAVDPDAELPLPTSPKGWPFLVDPTSTPDSSDHVHDGKTVLCSLNAAAAFPQEVYLSSGSSTYSAASEALRDAVGLELLGVEQPFHENVGFKGQGIVLSAAGAISVLDMEPLRDAAELTVQLFVKCVAGSTPNAALFEYGETSGGSSQTILSLRTTAAGALRAQLWVDDGSSLIRLSTASSGGVLQPGSSLVDREEGWRHVTATYRSDAEKQTSALRLYVDGELVDTHTLLSASTVATAGLDPYVIVGPGRSASPAPVTLSNMVFVIDEVAVSGVERTKAEIRRDAFVAPETSAYGPWPTAVSLPAGLDGDEAKWPIAAPYDAAIADLGEDLFHSTTLSASAGNPLVSGDRSCAFCHVPGASFTDGLEFPLDVFDDPLGPLNTPTLINAAWGVRKTHSGAAASIEDQIKIPLTSGPEMGTQTMAHVLARVQADPALDFQPFGGVVSEENLVEALAMYVRLQTAGGSAFDTGSLSSLAREGKELFFGKARCFGCHRGSNFSDDDFHNVRTVLGASTVEGLGGFNGRANDVGRVKTPSLRNLGDTGPYFHDGSLDTLDRVLLHYNDPFNSLTATAKGETDRDLRPLDLSTAELQALKAFLLSLQSP